MMKDTIFCLFESVFDCVGLKIQTDEKGRFLPKEVLFVG
jgi:hypothetical protein